MIIIASSGSGQLSSVFEGDVFKKVLSVFITAAILKLAQGRYNQLKWFCWHIIVSSLMAVVKTVVFVPFIHTPFLALYLCFSAFESMVTCSYLENFYPMFTFMVVIQVFWRTSNKCFHPIVIVFNGNALMIVTSYCFGPT